MFWAQLLTEGGMHDSYFIISLNHTCKRNRGDSVGYGVMDVAESFVW